MGKQFHIFIRRGIDYYIYIYVVYDRIRNIESTKKRKVFANRGKQNTVVLVDSHIQRVFLATEELGSDIINLLSCQSRSWSQEVYEEVKGSHHPWAEALIWEL